MSVLSVQAHGRGLYFQIEQSNLLGLVAASPQEHMEVDRASAPHEFEVGVGGRMACRTRSAASLRAEQSLAVRRVLSMQSISAHIRLHA